MLWLPQLSCPWQTKPGFPGERHGAQHPTPCSGAAVGPEGSPRAIPAPAQHGPGQSCGCPWPGLCAAVRRLFMKRQAIGSQSVSSRIYCATPLISNAVKFDSFHIGLNIL